MSAVLPDEAQFRLAGRAAAKVRRRVAAWRNIPPAARNGHKVCVSLPPEQWDALLAEAGR